MHNKFVEKGLNPPGNFDGGEVEKWLRRAAVAMTALMPLVVFPGITRPFSTPKIILLGGFVVMAGILVTLSGNFRLPPLPRAFRLSLIAWASALILSAMLGDFVSLEALWLSLFSLGWFLLITAIRPDPMHVAKAVAVSCVFIAAVALLQYLGLDPFRLLGLKTSSYGSPRMRVFGTLGNPNFVAAVLVAGLPISIFLGEHLNRRLVYFFGTSLLVAGLFATGSRAAIPAIIGAGLWLFVLRRFARGRAMVVAAFVMVLSLSFMPSRSILETLSGRFYVWKVTSSHFRECSLFGFGPGAFEPKFVEWETGYWREGRGTSDQRRFSGLQAHAHNDYLEILVDHGFAGILSLLLLLGTFVVFVIRQARAGFSELRVAASAGVIALAGVALVDFPLHRPTEQFLLWTLLALVYSQDSP